MADEDDTNYCSNCKRDIATVNFVMHEVHCRRNIVLCDRCDEPVPRSEMDSHFEEFHAMVTCDLCGQSLERAALDSHKEDDCRKRMKQCCFCELEVTFDALREHQDVCGSRTERCTKCSQYVMLRDQGRHDDSNCTYPTPRSTNSNNNHRSFSDDDLFMQGVAADMGLFGWGERGDTRGFGAGTGADLYQRGMNRSKRAPTNADRMRTNARGRSVNQTSTRPSRGASNGELQHMTRTLRANDFQHGAPLVPVANGDRRLVARGLDADEIPPRVPVANEDLHRDVPQTLVGNEFLPLELDANRELRHNVPRLSDVNPFFPFVPFADGDVAEPQRTGVANNTPPTANQHAQDPRVEELGDRVEAEDLTDLPCEFCGELYPADSLILHQGICRDTNTETLTAQLPSPIDAPNDVDTPQPFDLSRNQPMFGGFERLYPRPQTNNMLPPGGSTANDLSQMLDFEDNLHQLLGSRRLSHDIPPDMSHDLSPDMENPMIPCEFCDALLPMDTLIQHQATCSAGGLDSPQPPNVWQSPQATYRRSQNPRGQTDPIVSDIHGRRQQETNHPRNNRRNGPPQRNSGVFGTNNDSEEVSQVAPRWRNQRPPRNGGGEVSQVGTRWRNQRPANRDQEDVPPVDRRWRGQKSLGRSTLPPSVKDLMPKLAPEARNPVGNRTNQGNVRNGAGGTRRRQGGGERHQGGGETIQGGGERNPGGGERRQGGERNLRGGERRQGGGWRSLGGGERSLGGDRSLGGGERSLGGDRSLGGGERHLGGDRSLGGGERRQGGGWRSLGGRERRPGGAVAAEESLSHVVTEEAAVAVPMSPSVSPAEDPEDFDATFVKSVDDDGAEASGLQRSWDDEPSSLLRDISATPSYEPSCTVRGASRGRRTGGGPPNSQRPTKPPNRESGAPTGGRGRNRNKRGGSRRMPQGDI